MITGEKSGLPDETKAALGGLLLAQNNVPGVSNSTKAKFKNWSTERAIRDGYEANEWVHSCVDKIAIPAASVPWRVSKFTSRDAKARFDWEMKSVPLAERTDFIKDSMDRKEHLLEPQVGHPLEKLIEEPVKGFFDRRDAHERMAQWLLLGGNTISVKERTSGGVLVNLWPMLPDRMSPVPDRQKFISHYELSQQSAKPVQFGVQDVVHGMLPDPSNLYWGIGVLRGAARAVDLDVEAVNWTKNAFENSARPDLILAMQEGMSREEFEEARRQVRVQWQGSENAHTPILVGNSAKVQQASLSPIDMDWLKGREMNRTAIASVFGLNPKTAGVEASDEESDRQLWLSVIIPLLERWENLYNRTLSPEFSSSGSELYVWFDTANVQALQKAFHEKVKSAKLLTSMGIPFNTVNQVMKMGFPAHLPGLDEGYLPASTRSIREIAAGLQQPEITDGSGNQNTPADGGEVVDAEPLDEPVGELMPGGVGEDANKGFSREEAEAKMLEVADSLEGIYYCKDTNHHVFSLNGSDAEPESFKDQDHAGVIVEGRDVSFYHGERDAEMKDWAEFQLWKWARERREKARREANDAVESNSGGDRS